MSMLGTIDLGTEVGATGLGTDLGAMYYGAEVLATSTPPRISVRDLGAKICGTKMCYLGAMSPGADPQGPKMSLPLPGG